MRFMYIKLVGYAGFYHGMGLTELEIDFSTSKFPISVITGPNACGKSTLLNALNLLPDSNDKFEPGMNASKFMRIFDNGTIYEIFMNHPVDSKGNRAVTKVSILKDGVELNPNGNVSSYKDIIFNEFDLDSNYITLSFLSGTDRGLADKRPGERKKFITNIVSSLEVYNDINKTLNRKSNAYKSQLNAIGTKINNIGDASMLSSNQISLMTRQKRLTDNIEVLKARIVENTTKISIQDPDGVIHNKYEELSKRQKDLRLMVDLAVNSVINPLQDILGSEEVNNTNIENKLSIIATQIDTHNKSVIESDTIEKILISKINDIIMNNEKLNIRLNKLFEDINPDIEKELESINVEIAKIKNEFNDFNLGDINNISKDEVDQAVNTVNSILQNIDTIYSNIGIEDLKEFINVGGCIDTIINSSEYQLDYLKEEVQHSVIKLSELNNDLVVISDLDNRPDKCKIVTCNFIAKAINTLKQYGTKEALVKQIEDISNHISEIDNKIVELEKEVQKYKNMLSSEALLGVIRTMLSTNRAILSKIRTFTLLNDEEALLRNISNGYSFNEFRNLSELLYISNDITTYKTLVDTQKNLLSEYKVNKDKLNTYKEVQAEISANEIKLSDMQSELEQVKSTKNFNLSLVNDLTLKQTELTNLYESYKQYQSNVEELEKINKDIEEVKRQFTASEVFMAQIESDKTKIQEYNAELEPISNELRVLDTQLTLLSEYQKEYQDLQEKYTIIDKLKKYSSPVSGGIQTLFMNLYMSKTLDLANQLLSMIFGGQFQLADYVINQDEFRIPFTGRGLMVDDISSGSTSQICIMGMIINLVLLHQASSKFNITRLDEIDGGLDHQNRYMFVDILQKIVSILQIDQLFIISHSVESALSNVDVIQLAPMPDEESFVGANIIYSYKDRK